MQRRWRRRRHWAGRLTMCRQVGEARVGQEEEAQPAAHADGLAWCVAGPRQPELPRCCTCKLALPSCKSSLTFHIVLLPCPHRTRTGRLSACLTTPCLRPCWRPHRWLSPPARTRGWPVQVSAAAAGRRGWRGCWPATAAVRSGGSRPSPDCPPTHHPAPPLPPQPAGSPLIYGNGDGAANSRGRNKRLAIVPAGFSWATSTAQVGRLPTGRAACWQGGGSGEACALCHRVFQRHCLYCTAHLATLPLLTLPLTPRCHARNTGAGGRSPRRTRCPLATAAAGAAPASARGRAPCS